MRRVGEPEGADRREGDPGLAVGRHVLVEDGPVADAAQGRSQPVRDCKARRGTTASIAVIADRQEGPGNLWRPPR